MAARARAFVGTSYGGALPFPPTLPRQTHATPPISLNQPGLTRPSLTHVHIYMPGPAALCLRRGACIPMYLFLAAACSRARAARRRGAACLGATPCERSGARQPPGRRVLRLRGSPRPAAPKTVFYTALHIHPATLWRLRRGAARAPVALAARGPCPPGARRGTWLLRRPWRPRSQAPTDACAPGARRCGAAGAPVVALLL
ncbi:MAG: hypothetical protein J3K34DRAFT_418312 [Monoraphidium minutum]|nr:MAG: hypothetical protein J3K34DRAFT_418312 [Monoraphidium minutum]